jgi:methionyl aminopeptidase
MVNIYTDKEIEKLRVSGKILAEILYKVGRKAREGATTKELDALAEKLLRKHGAKPAFLNYSSGNSRPYPASLCTSINEEIVHCIPEENRILQGGDVVSLDLGADYQGLITDMALTVGVGTIDKRTKELLEATQKCLNAGIDAVKAGATTGDIGYAIESCAAKTDFSVVRDLVGHGVGRSVHEEPQVPNYGKPGQGVKLQAGMVLAIEPMLTSGRGEIKMLDDGWGIATADGSLSAHFEKTVLVTAKGCEVLTR